jgi:hypothetical protein
MTNEIIRHYTESGIELGRLSTAEGRLELDRTVEILDRFLVPTHRAAA